MTRWTGKHAVAVADDITTLYADAFDIQLSHIESFFEADPDPSVTQLLRVEQKVYWLAPKGD